jgi:hypothetical protein
MTRIPRRRAAALALASVTIGAAALAACSDSIVADGVAPAGTGTLRVRLTDAPMDTSLVKSVDVYVVRVDAKSAESDSAAADSNTTDGDRGRGGWMTIAEPEAKIDLLALRGGKSTQIGEQPLPTGNYRSVRMIIDPARSSITLTDGTVLTATSSPGVAFPSAARSGIKIKLDRSVTVGRDSASTMLIDFDAAESFQMKGPHMKNGLTFKPVIRATMTASTPPATPPTP